MHDLDGSLTGHPDGVALFNDAFALAAPNCRAAPDFKNGAICTNTSSQLRFAFNNFSPDSATLLNVTNARNRTVSVPMLKKRLTHPFGFMLVLEANQAYSLSFDNLAEAPTNMSYEGRFYSLAPNDFLIIEHPLRTRPDRVLINGIERNEFASLSPSSNVNFDWSWHGATSSVRYLVRNANTNRNFYDFGVNFSAFRCRYANCKVPDSPALRAAVNARSPDALLWSDPNTWLSEGGVRDRKIVTNQQMILLLGFQRFCHKMQLQDLGSLYKNCAETFLFSMYNPHYSNV
jgi:hypothetical protein